MRRTPHPQLEPVPVRGLHERNDLVLTRRVMEAIGTRARHDADPTPALRDRSTRLLAPRTPEDHGHGGRVLSGNGPAVDFAVHAAKGATAPRRAPAKLAGPKRPFLPPTRGSSTARPKCCFHAKALCADASASLLQPREGDSRARPFHDWTYTFLNRRDSTTSVPLPPGPRRDASRCPRPRSPVTPRARPFGPRGRGYERGVRGPQGRRPDLGGRLGARRTDELRCLKGEQQLPMDRGSGSAIAMNRRSAPRTRSPRRWKFPQFRLRRFGMRPSDEALDAGLLCVQRPHERTLRPTHRDASECNPKE